MENKFRLNTEIDQINHEKYGNAINDFETKCVNYNIVTLGQKIDFFTYLYNEDLKNKQKLLKKQTKKKHIETQVNYQVILFLLKKVIKN